MAGKHATKQRSWFARTFAPEMETKDVGDFPFDGYDSVGMPLISFSPGLVSAVRGEDAVMLDFSSLYRTNAAVYTVIDFLAWQLAQIGIKDYRRNGTDRTEVPNSEFRKLMNRPAPGLSYFRLIQGTATDLGVYGNAYWLKMGQGEAKALMPLPPFAVTAHGGTLVQASSYTVDIDGIKTTYSNDRIVHFRFPNPVDMRVGLSPLSPLRAILMEDTAATSHRRGYWANAARIEGLILRPKEAGPWGDAQRNRFREDWQNTYSGSSDAAGKTAILEDSMTWNPASFSPKDSEFIAGRKQVLETVCRAYNVPVSVLGLTDSATFASQKEFHRALYQDTLGPWLQMLAGEIEEGVLRWITDDEDVFCEHTIAEKLRGSFEEQADAVRAYVGVPIMSPDEGRKLFNLPAIGEEFDKPIKPLNVQYAGDPPGQAPTLEQDAKPPQPGLRAAQVIELPTKAEGEGQ